MHLPSEEHVSYTIHRTHLPSEEHVPDIHSVLIVVISEWLMKLYVLVLLAPRFACTTHCSTTAGRGNLIFEKVLSVERTHHILIDSAIVYTVQRWDGREGTFPRYTTCRY